ncbi:MAG TPA: heme exporter protein CcmB [Thermoanaerobaculia bacterium]|nr:heme exporter protein CcmB [Thermoanaerobaculia bacterium]
MKSPFLSQAAAVFLRDARRELRRRTTIAAVLFFAAAALILISFSLASVALPAGDRAKLNAGVLWILLFFSASSGLPRSFVREEESGTALALRKISGGEAVLAGKFLFNFLLFSAIAAVAVPLFCLLQTWTPANAASLAIVLVLSGWGVSFVSTFLSAIVSRAGQKDILFVLTALPLLMPLLLPAVEATARAAADPSFAAIDPVWKVLISYDGLATVGGMVLMRFVWEG